MRDEGIARVSIRDLPYPYRAMLSICSDLDETPDAATYLLTSQYLNSTRSSRFGTGLGLEVGNTMYFYMAPGEFSYWNTTDSTRNELRLLMRSGHIDCVHSMGDLCRERRQVIETLEHLAEHDCRLGVWIDHAVAPTNFGLDIMQGHGDVVGAEAYHADISLPWGIRFVWRGRVTSVQGQDVPPHLMNIWDASIPLRSIVTVAKEATKHLASAAGLQRYAIHRPNRILQPITLRDGSSCYEFLRCDPHPAGISVRDTAAGLGQVLSSRFLDTLESRRGKAIIYTHLGKEISPQTGFSMQTRSALEELATRAGDQRILIMTTRRLLEYCHMISTIEWTSESGADGIRILVDTRTPGTICDGLTFEVPGDVAVSLLVDGKPVARCDGNSRERTVPLMVPRSELEFPELRAI